MLITATDQILRKDVAGEQEVNEYGDGTSWRRERGLS